MKELIQIVISKKNNMTNFILRKYDDKSSSFINLYEVKGNYDNSFFEKLEGFNMTNIRESRVHDSISFKVTDKKYVIINDCSKFNNNASYQHFLRRLHYNKVREKLNNGYKLIKKNVKSNFNKRNVLIGVLSLGIIGGAAKVASTNNSKLVYAADNNHNLQKSIFMMNEESNVDNILVDTIQNNQKEINSTVFLANNILVPTAEKMLNVKIQNERKLEAKNKKELEKKYYESLSCKDDMIDEFSEIYYLDEDYVESLYEKNKIEIENSSNPKSTFIVMVKEAFYDSGVDKSPIISKKTREEKEAYIIHMAKDIYGIQDQDELAMILAIHRLETGNSSSNRCIYDNNLGGIREGSHFLTFKTFEIGSECFVRTVLKNIEVTRSNYDYDLTLEENLGKIYCEDYGWAEMVTEIKDDILDNDELDNYIDNGKVYKKTK